MGETRSYRCSDCGYAALVSGGDDVGMAVATTTVVCDACREVMDVVMGTPGLVVSSPRLRCVNNARHRVRRWVAPGACPRCGGL